MKLAILLLLGSLALAQVPPIINSGIALAPNGPCTPRAGYYGICVNQTSTATPSTFEWYDIQGNVFAFGSGSNQVSSVFGRFGMISAQSGDYSVNQITGAAPLVSPALTGTPTENGVPLVTAVNLQAVTVKVGSKLTCAPVKNASVPGGFVCTVTAITY